MTVQRLISSAAIQAGGAALLGMVVAGTTFAAAPHVISQAGRAFTPTEVSINRGDTVQIVNDDGDLLHHVYVDSDQMRFDSGDQKPGSRTNIVFGAPGTFTVLCAIHPKMKLTVRVR